MRMTPVYNPPNYKAHSLLLGFYPKQDASITMVISLHFFKVLFNGERQTALHIMGKEDGGQAGKIAGQTVFSAA